MMDTRSWMQQSRLGRRSFLGYLIGVIGLTVPASNPTASGEDGMYGIIGKLVAKPGRRDELIEVLLAGTRNMSGCLAYVVARDEGDEDAIWITEVWDDRHSHRSSMELPQVRNAMEQGRPLIEGFGERFETVPVGGVGLVSD